MRFTRGTVPTILIVWLSLLDSPVSGQSGSDQNNAKLLNELQAIRSSIQEIQGRLEKLESAARAYPRVHLKIQSRQGKPLSGYRIEMESKENQGRLVRATSTSGPDGVILDRSLPHGEYRIELEEPTGWSTRFSKVVEFGHPMEMTIVAPDPADRGTITLTSGLTTEAFAGMQFGVKRRKVSNGYVTYPTPEPGADQNDMATYPTVQNGVTVVAVSATLGVNQRIEQPDGDVRIWHWYLRDHTQQSRFLFRSDQKVMQFEENETGITVPQADSGFFEGEFADSSMESEQHETQLELIRLRNTTEPTDTVKLRVPAGKVTVSSSKFLALINNEVMQTLKINRAGGPVWLEADLRSDSAWPARVLDLDDWVGYRSRTTPFRREVKLTAGREQEVRLRSAK